jgi:hypothetical protein
MSSTSPRPPINAISMPTSAHRGANQMASRMFGSTGGGSPAIPRS